MSLFHIYMNIQFIYITILNSDIENKVIDLVELTIYKIWYWMSPVEKELALFLIFLLILSEQ